MNSWLDHLMHDPISENVWALAALILLGGAMFGPVLIMIGRDMWRRRKQETMTDEPSTTYTPLEPGDRPYADQRDPQAAEREAAMSGDDVQPLPQVGVFTEPAVVDAETEARWKAQGIDTEQMVTATGMYVGAAAVPAPLISPQRVECAHCQGRGYVPGLNDLLKESLDLLGDKGDEVIRAFYSRLFMAAPHLRTIFPGDPTQGDLGTDHKGARQRELLLNAIAALADLYDPSDDAKMERLDAALKRFGRTHASFDRKDGTVKGATLEEYAAVKDALFTTLIRTAADAWKAEYSEAWSQAYDYAAAVMLAEQMRSGFTAPRFARQG